MYSKENDSEADWFEFPYCRNKCNQVKYFLDCEAMPKIVEQNIYITLLQSSGHIMEEEAKRIEEIK